MGACLIEQLRQVKDFRVKDVIFDEDHSTIRMGNAPGNLSVMRTIALNIRRRNGYFSITQAQRFISHDIDKLLSLVG
ncbi:transposase [Calothrix sp. NIES-2100]|nr:transposase [Calothrix sp. NIES-2100]